MSLPLEVLVLILLIEVFMFCKTCMRSWVLSFWSVSALVVSSMNVLISSPIVSLILLFWFVLEFVASIFLSLSKALCALWLCCINLSFYKMARYSFLSSFLFKKMMDHYKKIMSKNENFTLWHSSRGKISPYPWTGLILSPSSNHVSNFIAFWVCLLCFSFNFGFFLPDCRWEIFLK